MCVRKYPVMREGDFNLAAKSLVRNYRTRNIDIFEVHFNYCNVDKKKIYTEQYGKIVVADTSNQF